MTPETRLTPARLLEAGDTLVDNGFDDVIVVDVEVDEPFAFVRVRDAGTFRARWRLAANEHVRVVTR